jgi:hypothetical protein
LPNNIPLLFIGLVEMLECLRHYLVIARYPDLLTFDFDPLRCGHTVTSAGAHAAGLSVVSTKIEIAGILLMTCAKEKEES